MTLAALSAPGSTLAATFSKTSIANPENFPAAVTAASALPSEFWNNAALMWSRDSSPKHDA